MSAKSTAFHANLRRGRLLRQTGRYQEACEFLGAAIQLDPEQPEPYLELALAQSEMPGQKKEALRSIDRAVGLDPESDYYVGYKAYLLARFGRRKEALDFADQALAISPLSHLGLLAQTNVHTQMGDWPKAEESARRMLELDAEDTSALNLLAQSLRMQHRYREAGEVLSYLLSREPEDAFGLTNAGYEALSAGNYRRANELFLAALRVDPKCAHARRGLLQSLRSRVWIYRVNQQIIQLLSGGKHHGHAFRIVLIVLVVGTGGLFLGVILLYAFIALTMQPISDFFLLFDPKGRRALTIYERRGFLFGAIVGCYFLVLLAFAGFPKILVGITCYLALFALCVLIPQWLDAWQARREEKLMAQESPSP